jgi:hypothetical protein
MAEEPLSYPQIRYNQYSRQRGELSKTNVELGGRYDQWILTLSAGALGLSVAFLEKIAPHPEVNTIFLIGLAWVFLVVGLLSGLISLLTAQYSAAEQIQILDEEYREYLNHQQENKGENPVAKAPAGLNKYAQTTDYLNWISAPAFVIGVVFLCVFAYSNIPRKTPIPSLPVLPPQMDVNVKIQNLPLPEPVKKGTNYP